MGERAHTPGPWRVDDRYDDQIVGRPMWPCRRSGVEGEWRVATADLMDGNEAEMAANAHLIAAAPDMFEALKACHKFLCRQAPNNDALLDVIDAALAKASPSAPGEIAP